MLNISDALKTIYISDQFPYTAQNVPKDIEAVFPSLSKTFGTELFAVDKGDFELTESICTDDNLKFGKCNSSQVKFTLADVTDDIKGKEFDLNQYVKPSGTTYTMPLGKFSVDTVDKQDDLRFKDIVAYDRMKRIDTDVASWYNGLFPTGNETYTLAAFRASFLAYVGLTQDTSKLPLPNDSMVVKKTIEPSQLYGRTVIEACEEINGCFGHINRYGLFTHIILKPAYGLYPAETLYPASSLFPISSTDTSFVPDSSISEKNLRYQSIRFAEYTVKEIDKLIIRQEENDVGAIIGTGTNAYIIQSNFLVYGKSAAELEIIGQNAFSNINKRPYRPYECDCIGLPYIEVGDALGFTTEDTVISYVFNRTLTGIQALKDTFAASGQEEQAQEFGVSNQIIQLEAKTTKIKKDVDGVRVDVEDLADSTAASFEITNRSITQEVSRATQEEGKLNGKIAVEADRVTAEVSRATQEEGRLDGKITVQSDRVTAEVTRATDQEGFLLGQIDVLANSITLKVDANGVIAAINLSPETVKIAASKIIFEGLVTANNNFKILTDGSIEAVNGKFSGKIAIKLNDSATSLYGNNGTTDIEVISYRVENYPDGTTYNSIVVGDSTNGTRIDGSRILITSSGVAGLRGTSSYLGSYYGGGYRAVFYDHPYFYPSNSGILGEPNHYWDRLYIGDIYQKSGASLGFFGTAPVTRKAVSKLSTGATLSDVITKINSILDALGDSTGYGLLDT